MLFSTAGIPFSAKKPGMVAGLQEVRSLSLGGCEWEFVRGVRFNPAHAKEVGEAAKRENVSLSCHAPYFLNLLSDETKKKGYSHHLILESARMLNGAVVAGAPCGDGGGRVVFHAGYYLKKPPQQAMNEMREEFKLLLKKKKEERLCVVFAPELTGKPSAWGSLNELCALCGEFSLDDFNPCIDFAHYLARGNALSASADYEKVFDSLKKSLGIEALLSLHCHFSGIRFSEKGEINHLPIAANAPPFAPLAEALRKKRCGGTIVCESPLNEKDALEMQRVYSASAAPSKK